MINNFKQLVNHISNPKFGVTRLIGLYCLVGNNKDGLAVGSVIASGSKAADLAISYLESHTKHNNSH